MRINLNIKIKAGPHTPVQVDVYGTSVNEKTIQFANGLKLSETEIANWMKAELTKAIKKVQDQR